MPSVQDAVKYFGLSQHWVPTLISLQKHFGYVYYSSLQTRFEIAFEVRAPQGLRKVILTITLPSTFPHSPPQIFCINERHRYIKGQVYQIDPSIHAGLTHWTSSNDLGAILADIYTKIFQNDPPQGISPIWNSTSNSLWVSMQSRDPIVLNSIIDSSSDVHLMDISSPSPSNNPSHTNGSSSSINGSSSSTLRPPSSKSVLPNPPDFSAELTKMDFGELLDMHHQPDILQCYFNSLDAVQNLEHIVEEYQKKNSELEELTVSFQQELDEAHNQKKFLHEQLELKKARLEQLRARKREIQTRYSKEATAEKLFAASQKDEHTSEWLASLFKSGADLPEISKPMDLLTFLARFMEARIAYRIRLDKGNILLANAGPSQPPHASQMINSSTSPHSQPFRTHFGQPAPPYASTSSSFQSTVPNYTNTSNLMTGSPNSGPNTYNPRGPDGQATNGPKPAYPFI